ncbi:FecR family protein [Mucilaginibacter paludis]|uniref:Anti-FecI sigma factor, FecR n=1 Tax=Mucilaginibacter paludis DSM 18603 TaxID=714943 RepID=H1Y334_9SPHI|nr:FecR domain-containing protein [Mucilaginibacter paludis]EHQ28852.1 anti-FecI sigma factor, FecR [Mucilaginibacter paludis DSM 18603]
MDKERVKDLLFGYLNGTLSAEELDELLGYAQNEAYEEVFYESMGEEWKIEKPTQAIPDEQVQRVYQKTIVDPRFAQKNTGKIFSLFNIRYIGSAAAVLLVAVGVYFYASRSAHTGSEYANDVNPGGNKALLTLSNGHKVSLDQSTGLTLQEQSGIRISKSGKGQLIYTTASKNNAHSAGDVVYNTLQTPNGGQYQLVLPDGTKVWLNSSSSIKYPASFASLKERKVMLQGEAYFEVAHNRQLPFRVVSNKQTVEVLGTHFNINAYIDEPVIATTLLEGSVKVTGEASAAIAVLKPGQQAQYGSSISVSDVDTETIMAWKNGDFILKDNDFKTTMRKIARWYDVQVIYDPSAPQDLELGGWVSRSKNISAVLKIMESTGKVHFKVNGRRVIVTK